MTNKALILTGILLLSLQGRAQGLPSQDLIPDEYQTSKDILILQTSGRDRALLQKILSTTDLSVLSEDEKIRAVLILETIEMNLNTSTKPWVRM